MRICLRRNGATSGEASFSFSNKPVLVYKLLSGNPHSIRITLVSNNISQAANVCNKLSPSSTEFSSTIFLSDKCKLSQVLALQLTSAPPYGWIFLSCHRYQRLDGEVGGQAKERHLHFFWHFFLGQIPDPEDWKITKPCNDMYNLKVMK